MIDEGIPAFGTPSFFLLTMCPNVFSNAFFLAMSEKSCIFAPANRQNWFVEKVHFRLIPIV